MAVGMTGMGKAPTGSIIAQPDRPNTASRGGPMMGPPGTSAGRPPGTAMRGAAGQPPPSTAYKRLGTAAGRPGTGQQAGPGGPRTGTNVQVENRPITQHGVLGMKFAGGGGGGRKVLDKNYFMNELRQKRMEIANVTQKMREELEALEKRQSQYNTMDKKCTDLMKEVKLLQESLADYNTVLDKVGSQTPTYAIQQEHAVLREGNESKSKRVDDVLTERLALEQKARQAEAKIQEIQQNMDQRLNSMPPSQRQQYYDLVAEQAALTQEAKRFEEAMDELDRQLNTQEGELARNPLKQRSLQLQEQIRQLTEKKYELQQEEERSKQSPEEQREQLMAKIKRDNNEVEQVSGAVRDMQEQIKRMEARISSMSGNSPAINAAEEAAKREKYDELVAKERDLTNFMDSFPSRRAAKLDENRNKQDSIVGLLERINKLQSIASGALPSTKKFKEMQDELEYKKMQLENTQMTQERLKEELTMRRSELDKIDTLEDKIKTELAQLADKSEQLRKQVDTFNNVGDMRTKAETTRGRLEALRAALLKRRELLRVVVAEKALKIQARKAQLQENNVQIAIEKLEQKLRTLHTNIYQMQDFVKLKESETNYKALSLNISQLADEVNNSVKRAIA
eukprot:CAMPEP_0202869542 /NCGR_PEP_ID=MMETSP1391-20130828/12512_1 /ASSEMBLY_ACC=CAM_ASM_000867 /TAXON_ID=1034604 /ORGANISM="Chlamydomonas leiostraca, Strain SAG 11-49" /LENGTH=623 /DNA_ID=CAMNT_0049549875 /DNA_START=192 /DNA_END=2063 /DNA_ORIENTATION=+